MRINTRVTYRNHGDAMTERANCLRLLRMVRKAARRLNLARPRAVRLTQAASPPAVHLHHTRVPYRHHGDAMTERANCLRLVLMGRKAARRTDTMSGGRAVQPQRRDATRFAFHQKIAQLCLLGESRSSPPPPRPPRSGPKVLGVLVQVLGGCGESVATSSEDSTPVTPPKITAPCCVQKPGGWGPRNGSDGEN